MIEINDTAVVLSRRHHGAGGAIVSLHSAEHGRLAGHVQGIRSPANRGLWLTGNLVTFTWRGRRDGVVGFLEGSVEASPAADLEGSVGRLTAIAAACGLVAAVTPEREPAPDLHADLPRLLPDDLHREDWRDRYTAWEARLSTERGYGPPQRAPRPSTADALGPVHADLATSAVHLASHALADRRRGMPVARRAFGRVVAAQARAAAMNEGRR